MPRTLWSTNHDHNAVFLPMDANSLINNTALLPMDANYPSNNTALLPIDANYPGRQFAQKGEKGPFEPISLITLWFERGGRLPAPPCEHRHDCSLGIFRRRHDCLRRSCVSGTSALNTDGRQCLEVRFCHSTNDVGKDLNPLRHRSAGICSPPLRDALPKLQTRLPWAIRAASPEGTTPRNFSPYPLPPQTCHLHVGDEVRAGGKRRSRQSLTQDEDAKPMQALPRLKRLCEQMLRILSQRTKHVLGDSDNMSNWFRLSYWGIRFSVSS